MTDTSRNVKQTKAQKELMADIASVISTSQGRNVLNYFIRQSGYGMPAFKGATNETMHNLGMQSLGTQIVQACQAASPDNNLKMITERLNVR